MEKKRFIFNLILVELIIFIVAISLTISATNKNIENNTFETLKISRDMIVGGLNLIESKDQAYLEKTLKEILNEQTNVFYAIYSDNGNILIINHSDLSVFSSKLNDEEINKINSEEKVQTTKRVSGKKYCYVSTSVKLNMDQKAYVVVAKSIKIDPIQILYIVLIDIMIFLSLTFILYFLQKQYNQFNNMRTLSRIKIAQNSILLKNNKLIDVSKIKSSKDEKMILEDINKVNAGIIEQFKVFEEENDKNIFIIDHMAQTLFGINKNNNITLSNETARRIFKNQAIAGQNVINLFLEDDKKEVLEIIQQGIATRREYLIQSEFYRAEFIFLNNINIHNIKYFILLTNIDELKNGQKNKNEFFANASHELKTPLTAILGYSEIIESTKDNKLLKECNKEINQNATRMVQLIRLMLDYAKIDNNSDILKNRENIDLRVLVTQILKNNKYQIEQNNISIDVIGNVVINANKINIELMLGNLIENAVKYNKPSGLVNVELYESTKSVIINVIDSGIGIPDEEKANIFKTFYKINRSGKKDNFSSGLGLGIVKKIVDLYGGNIICDNNEYGGTTFRIEFFKH